MRVTREPVVRSTRDSPFWDCLFGARSAHAMPTPKRDLSFFVSLPSPEVYDASRVRGNVLPEQKSLAINIFAYFVWSEGAWGCEVGKKIRLVELNVWERDGGRREGETVCEILVERGECAHLRACLTKRGYRDICNVHEVLAGGAVAHIIDWQVQPSILQSARLNCLREQLLSVVHDPTRPLHGPRHVRVVPVHEHHFSSGCASVSTPSPPSHAVSLTLV
jgi:hypothetical protein